ncbi:unnamed protein product [Xylocopa violacea]|uniref:NADH dehydrogenase [ubiquinone] 1 beta subcomplex subunit 10 n=1 Tax=Xylocopa violacea TaxID=135666 RepID=A0ABP1MXF2_XYLVO
MDTDVSSFFRFMNKFFYLLDGPVDYIREKVVLHQQKYPWYHRQFRRVPTIAECSAHDQVCIAEAQMQFHRDRMVDAEILNILRERYEDCAWYYEEDRDDYCDGGLGATIDVEKAFLKQKHRMIWERRHGPVGGGATNKKYDY